MFTIVFVILCLLICYKLGAWRRWKDFYPTISYVIIGDLVYNFVFFNHMLWRYESLVNHTMTNLLFVFVVFPSAIIVFLTHYPQKRWKQLLYILLWVLVNTGIEYVSVLIGDFSFHNGWNIFYSLGFYTIAFSMIRLHYKHPLVAWPISMALCFVTMILFGLPLSQLK